MPKLFKRTRTRKYRHSKKKYGKKRNTRTRRYRHKGGVDQDCIDRLTKQYSHLDPNDQPTQADIEKWCNEK